MVPKVVNSEVKVDLCLMLREDSQGLEILDKPLVDEVNKVEGMDFSARSTMEISEAGLAKSIKGAF